VSRVGLCSYSDLVIFALHPRYFSSLNSRVPIQSRHLVFASATEMYHDDEEDLYTPRIRPAVVPSRSKYAPYFSGRSDELEDFMEEFEGRASIANRQIRSELTHSRAT
jgi:hypothetical protein